MTSFLEGKNRAPAFKSIGSALGIDDATMTAISKVYDVAAGKLGNYIKLGGALVVGAGTAVEIVAEFIKFAGLVNSGKSEIAQLYDKIHADILEVEGKIASASRHSQDIERAKIIASITSCQQIIADYISPTINHLPNDQAAAQVAGIGKDVHDNVNTLMQYPFWTRLQDDKLVYKIPGQDEKHYRPPAEGDPNLVWDYTLALPALLNAIDTLISYWTVTDRHFQQNKGAQIATIADFLTVQHERIRSGLVLVQAPGPIVGAYQPLMGIMPSSQWFADFWAKWGQPCGAVDCYAGTALIEQFPLSAPRWHVYFDDLAKFRLAMELNSHNEVKNDQFAPQLAEGQQLQTADLAYWRQFNLLFLARSLRLRAALEDRIGLPALRQVIEKLRGLSLGAPGKEPPPTHHGLSLADIVQPPAAILAQLAPDGAALASSVGPVPAPSIAAAPHVNGFQVFWPPQVHALAAEFAAASGAPLAVALRPLLVGADDVTAPR